jgi:hypothetical protein
VGDLEHLDAGVIERAHDRVHLVGGEPVTDRVGSVAQAAISQPDRESSRVHRQPEVATVVAVRARASSSPTLTAAAVMMSRLPA